MGIDVGYLAFLDTGTFESFIGFDTSFPERKKGKRKKRKGRR